MVIIITMFVGNAIYGSLMSTGAFEVYLDNKLVFSKIKSGIMPTPQDLDRLLAWEMY